MTDTTNSSPETLRLAAQEVDNAIADIEAQIEFVDLAAGFNAYRKAVAAAALRAVADQVVPPEQERLFNEERPWDVELCSVVDVRLQLLAIATELERTNDTSGGDQ